MNIIFWACVGVLLIEAEPIILMKRWFGFKDEKYDAMSKIMRFFHRLITCAMCLTFWVALICTWNIETAAISSILAALIHKKILQ